MIIQPPETIEDFKNIRETTMELMANPYCDHQMFISLLEKLAKVEEKIKELEKVN